MQLSDWALDVLRAPGGAATLRVEGDTLVDERGSEVARVEDGILRFRMDSVDASIAFYRDIGGAHFYEATSVPYAMSSLDTPVYQDYLRRVEPESVDSVIVDIGGGDGRTAKPWLERGFRRVVVIDAAGEALVRFRKRIEAEEPQWLERLLLVEADARALPLADSCAMTVTAIETLYYLNEDFERGLREAVRILSSEGRLLSAERNYEGGIVSRLLYDGVAAMLQTAESHELWDGTEEKRVRTRLFTESELRVAVESCGACVEWIEGISIVPLLTGWIRQRAQLGDDASVSLQRVQSLVRDLATSGNMRRCHVLVARRATRP